MRVPTGIAVTLLLLAIQAFAPVGRAQADEKTAAELFPSTAIAYAELTSVGELVEMVMEHPLRPQIMALEPVEAAYASKDYLQFRAGVTAFEAKVGKPWRKIIDDVADGGVYAAFDPATQGVAMLVKAKDEQSLKDVLEAVLEFARSAAKENDQPDPIRTGEYRGVQSYKFDDNRVAQLGQWLLLTNKRDLGVKIVDAFKDGQPDSLVSSERFAAARKTQPANANLWAFVDVERIRKSGIPLPALTGKSDNPVIEMLIGGLLSTARNTPYATASLEAKADRLSLSLEAPHDASWTPEVREYYYGPKGEGRAPAAIQLPNQIFTLSTYRDFSQMWLRAGDLFDENINDEFAKADGTLSTFFAGKDFGEDILGALQPEVQLLVTRQDLAKITPKPSIELPAFAIVGSLREPEKMQRELKRTFQSLIGFLNVVGAMNGQPQLDLDMQRNGDAMIVSSQYAPEEDEKDSKKASIHFNFSPSVAFRNDVFVISSTLPLAEEIVKRTEKSPEASSDNTFAAANVNEIRKALDANREHIIAQNMLDNGNTREEAENEIGLLITLMNIVDKASLRLSPGEKTMRLSVQLSIKETLEQ